jgi:hypothetical protein
MRVVYKEHWPDAVRAVVAEHVDRALALGLLPGWLEDLWVYYDQNEKEHPATMDVDPCYWNGKLILASGFVEAAPEARDEMLVHEFFHVHTAPLVLILRDMAEVVGKSNEALGERYAEEVRRANERATVGLEAAFARARVKR